jgi:hypothetical protein
MDILVDRGDLPPGDTLRGAGRRVVARILAIALLLTPAIAAAGNVSGKIDLPPGGAGAPPVRSKGFLDRSDNPHLPARAMDPMPQLVVVLVGGDAPASAPPQVVWELLGESFARPVLPVAAGTPVLIKNLGKGSPVLRATEAPDLIQPGPINPRAGKELKVGAGPVYTITDPSAPYLVGRIVVMPSRLFATPDSAGRFDIADVPPGAYTLRIWFRDGWIERADDAITVAGGRKEINPKIPAGFPAAGTPKAK